MKTPPSNRENRWENLVRQARADVGPPTDVAALLRVVLGVPRVSVPRESWIGDFSSLFPSARVIPACLAGATAFALVATWQAWDSWQAFPWVQLLDITSGGAS
jgi:hypothetical protein